MALTNAERVRRYREKNREFCGQAAKAWRADNKERIARSTKKYHLKKKGFTLDSYAVAKALQGDSCAICRTPFDELRPSAVHADHDHATNEPRGVLCTKCNTGLGLFNDSPESLERAIQYLQTPTMKETKMLEPKVEELAAAVAANTAAIVKLTQAWLALASNAQAVATEAKPGDTIPAGGKPIATVKEDKPKTEPKKGAAEAPKPVVAPSAPETTAAPAASSIDYATLQKAVFALAGKSREAAAAVAASFGVKTFKELDADKWGEALGAVQEKLAELESA